LLLIDFKIFVLLKYHFHFPSIFCMNTAKINKLLKALPSDVVARFGKTLKPKTTIQRLFMCLNNPKKDLNDTDKMARYVFEKQRANPSKSLQNEGYKLLEVLQKWLVKQELEADELIQNQLLANAFKRYKVTDAYFEILTKREKLIETETARDSTYHWASMRLSHARYFHPQTDFPSQTAEANFTKTIDHLDDFYLLTRLRYIAERNMRNYNFGLPQTLPKQETMLRPAYKDKPLARLCMLAAKLIEYTDNQLFRKEFCPLLEKYIHLADAENQGTLATYRINYTSRQTQAGHADFMRDQFDAYKFAIENGYLEHEGHLDETHFLNAVTVAAVLHEFEAGEQLINEASVRLKNNTKSINNLAEAYLCFYQLSYEKTYKLFEKNELLKEPFNNAHTDLRSRSLKAQCMYQLILEDYEKFNANDLINHLNAYQRFLQRRDRFSENPRQSNLNFTNLLKKMANKPKKEAKALLENFLKADKPIILKKWLLDVVNK